MKQKERVTEEIVNDFAVGIGDVTDDLVAVRWPVRGFGERQFAVDAPRVVDDDQFSVLIHPALASEQIVDACGYFIPRVVILATSQTNIDRPYKNINIEWSSENLAKNVEFVKIAANGN